LLTIKPWIIPYRPCTTLRFFKTKQSTYKSFQVHWHPFGAFLHSPLMSLTSFDIGRIAKLARLELAEPQRARMLDQLNGFFDIVEQMNAVDTTGVEPLAHPTAVIDHVSLRLRPDLASEPNQREANQASAPAVERGLFLVPRVME
jgi:aspartyl-tRNA(Asn)/glutamyl-tRNA(Gln) amidotransferase subunit C